VSQYFDCKFEVGPKERGMICGSIEVRTNKGLMICGLGGWEGRGRRVWGAQNS
jgi:hypothetical protein